MTSSVPPVLVVGGGPAGLVAALTLLRNKVPVRIIDKEHEYRIAEFGNVIYPRTFKLFHFLRVPEARRLAEPFCPLHKYMPGIPERSTIIPFDHADPTPPVPYDMPLCQPALEGILRSHLEKCDCTVELGTELQSFEVDGDRVLAKLVKRKDDEEITETFKASYLIGADGDKGVTRKLSESSLTWDRPIIGDKFVSGRVFVVGDAAHVHDPVPGQCLRSSVEESLNLAWKLSLVHKHHSPPTLLDSYTAECLSFKFYSTEPWSAVAYRNYRTSTLVRNEFSTSKCVEAYKALGVDKKKRALVAGDHAPDACEFVWLSRRVVDDAQAEGQRTLFDVFNAVRHTVLVFVPDVQASMDVLEALQAYPGDYVQAVVVLPEGSETEAVMRTGGVDVDVLVDRDGHAYRAYMAVVRGKRAVVVRPDGFVGAIVRGVDGVKAYFSNIFLAV